MVEVSSHRGSATCFCSLPRVGTRAFGGGSLRVNRLNQHIRIAMVSTDKTSISSSLGEKIPGARLLEEVEFENSFVDKLPADPEEEVYVRPVRGAAYSRVIPTPPWVDDQSEYLGKKKTSSESSLQMVAWSSSCARLLGIDDSSKESMRTISVLAGAEVTPTMKPYAQCYGGHQFGSWADQLGDGRVINLGEVVNEKGEKYEIQLKGAGKTPYSRSADGRAVVSPSLTKQEMEFHPTPSFRE
uniref:Selenoprotein O n=1 Tax=Rhodosorus marinus TaxID=101924 RepID=A0A7S2ZS43_9RHOD|mmetsp:Transcript_30681/g.117430  ORF Transcript_30681/g.117430 Transcript_30681/m.117430 type:complete len:242 (+) Transcript_30681:285-1010(+)